ncbi:DUF4911 domain-containing protein [Pseudodesulfovibrio sp. F-1]|uniref:DUF4911 domain-containing protein n=1 Tax=Pseudodesulfovibrio alkaliphilus TaxID=2661613 RepID=A0A7K1KKU4_9BACT|nr:DUF4911 domain-containing protein [Pseudodesulfovibrio alkaliphilus]MUM76698.1 DUF4911 domain-containing protein [Pseudodesulfovibrio alkaliphilus]
MKNTSRRKPRKRACPPPPLHSARTYVRVEPSKIGLFRFLLEAHDNLGVFTVTNRFTGILQLRYSPHMRREMRSFLDAAATEMALEVVLDPGGATARTGRKG